MKLCVHCHQYSTRKSQYILYDKEIGSFSAQISIFFLVKTELFASCCERKGLDVHTPDEDSASRSEERQLSPKQALDSEDM